jgi:hypothetical protein
VIGDMAPSPVDKAEMEKLTPDFRGSNKGKIFLRPSYFASDYGGGAPTPEIAARWTDSSR